MVDTRERISLKNSKKLIIYLSIILGLLLAVVFNFVKNPVYQSRGMVEVSVIVSGVDLSEGQYTQTVDERFSTECRKILSYPVIREALEALGIITGELSGENGNRRVASISKHIGARRIKGTNIVEITAKGTDPQKITLLINKLMKVYIKKRKEEDNKHSIKFKVQLEKQIEDVSNSLVKVKKELKDDLKNNGHTDNMEILRSKLTELKLELVKLMRKYNDKHPAIIDIKQQIQETERQSEFAYKRIQLTETINNKENLAENLGKKLKELLLEEDEGAGNYRIISPAIEPLNPVSPKKLLNLLLGGGIGALLGCILYFGVGKKEITLKDIEKIEDSLKIPVLGIIPHIKDAGQRNAFIEKSVVEKLNNVRNRLLLNYSSSSVVAEAFFSLWTNMKFAAAEKEEKVLLFTSADEKEGKTLTIANYAIASAMAGVKTLLIEADSRAPLIHKIFNLSGKPGLSEIVLEDSNWRDMLQKPAISADTGNMELESWDNLKIITQGEKRDNPVSIYNSSKLDSFISETKQEFELILFDTHPLLMSSEPLILSSKVDGIIIVHQAKKVPGEVVKRAKTQVDNVYGNILGIILNNVKISDKYPHYEYSSGRYIPKEKGLQIKADKKGIKKVLIIDDESKIVNVITRMLLKKARYEYDIASVGNGLDAIKKMEDFRPDLVVLDLNLPGVDGFQICKRIRKDMAAEDIKILAITGYDNPGTREEIIKCGANEYLTKPFDFKKFMECVNTLPL